MISLIRYPGSKAKLVGQIMDRFPANMKLQLWSSMDSGWEYREPFFGAGSVGLEVMNRIDRSCSVWINDVDPAMFALWTTIKEQPILFMQHCTDFEPSIEAFYRFKEEDGRTDLPLPEQAFRKVALHRMSFSGFGAMAGGPIGGKKQSSAYNVSCRWNLQKIKAEAMTAHRVMNRFARLRITCCDFAHLIDTANEKTFVYLDPPYYEKGEQLYKFNMDDAAHARLRDSLNKSPATWMLSYDDHPRVRELYAGCAIEPIYATYSNAVQKGGTRPKNQEVLIFKPTARESEAAA